ncbi:MAG TPA: Bax inhibitor-1 family protein [Candidatus Paceibacterota bacterium]|nr:Bax inhibitor-1 family protein [Candidatus Paceibacterota bacterium]
MLESGVFERYGRDDMSRGVFYMTIGGVLTVGFLISAYVSTLTAAWAPNLWVFLGVGLVIPILGIILGLKSDNPVLSLLGFLMVVVPFGAILGPVLAAYKVSDPGLITETALLTGAITGVMMLSGLAFPNFYSKIGGALFVALLCVVGVSIVGLFVPGVGQLTWVHYAAAGVFALYIGYDMHRASTIPATLDNAIDVATSLYLDIINLFLRLLAARSRS